MRTIFENLDLTEKTTLNRKNPTEMNVLGLAVHTAPEVQYLNQNIQDEYEIATLQRCKGAV